MQLGFGRISAPWAVHGMVSSAEGTRVLPGVCVWMEKPGLCWQR